MFQQAYAIASNLTWPSVISICTLDGRCGSGIGTFVVVNDEGWIVTAGHVLKKLNELANGRAQAQAVEAEIQVIDNDNKLRRNERDRRIAKLRKLNKDLPLYWSSWWGIDGINVQGGAGNLTRYIIIVLVRCWWCTRCARLNYS